ncbi:hypothetical protein [Streptomyces asoensis]|uniref:hypothetical protein n=1 Tax=Streptomyces asoensis TaxID=249586 RepID=UPI0033E66600
MDRRRNDTTAFPGDRYADDMFAAYRAQPLIEAYLADLPGGTVVVRVRCHC